MRYSDILGIQKKKKKPWHWKRSWGPGPADHQVPSDTSAGWCSGRSRAVEHPQNFHIFIRAGHLRYFLKFFNSNKWCFCIFIKLMTYIYAPVLFIKPTPSQINLIKNNFLLLKKLKNSESAQLWFWLLSFFDSCCPGSICICLFFYRETALEVAF